MDEEKDVVEVMARAIFEAEGRAKDVRWEDADSVLFVTPADWSAKPPSATDYFRSIARAAFEAAEAAGYKITKSLTPGISHPRERYKGEG